MIGYGKELPEDEAIGVGCGWWPSFGIASGAYLKLNGEICAALVNNETRSARRMLDRYLTAARDQIMAAV